MRVTEAHRFNLLRSDIERASGDMARMTEKLASGRAISRLSDAPEMAVQAERMSARDRAIDAYVSAADNARAWLATQDSALQGSVNVMHRVRELAIAAGVPQGTQAREGIAAEIEGLREQLIALANTTFNGRAVFGGFGQAAVEVQTGAVAYVGDDGVVQRRIAENQVVQVNTSGREAFGFAAGDDVFAFLTDLAAHVRAGDVATTSGSDLERLEAQAGRFVEALGAVGTSVTRVETVNAAAVAEQDALRERISSIVDADLAETTLELTLAETAYQSVLAATARLQLPNLVDYLR
jgi:flagellar hook-associated protein 3 FlgL